MRVRFALAMLPPLAALVLQWLLWDFISPYAWFLFYPAVFLSSWIGGRAAGLAATAVSVTIVWWFFIPPEHVFLKTHLGYFFPATVFLGMGVLFSFFHSRLRNVNRQATEALTAVRAGEARLNEAQRIARIGSWELNLLDNTLIWSDECYRIFEVDPAAFDVSYQRFLDLVHPEDRAAVDSAYTESVKTRVPYSIDHRLAFPDGRIKFVHEHCETIYADGRPLRSIGTVQDITERKRAEEALHNSEERFRQLIEQAPDGIFIADLEGRYTDVNTAGCRMLGLRRDEIVGKTIMDFIPPEDVERLQLSKEQLLRGDSQTAEWTLRRTDGSFLPVEVSASIMPDGRWQGFVRDISARKQADVQLRQAATVFDNTMEGILITDAERNIVAVNQAYTTITGFTPTELLGKNPRMNQSGLHDKEFYRALWQTVEDSGQWQGELWNRRKDGEVFAAWENISAVKDGQGRITHYVAMLADISPIKQAEERLSHLAHHDTLTGLPNRLAFAAGLEQALERAKRHRQKLALLFLDLDRFKLINDTLGHAAGDKLLQVIAERLRNSVRAEDVAARLGGDEFTIILEEISHAEAAAQLAKKIIRAVAEPVDLHGREVVTSTSIGISIYPDDAGNVSDLAKAADAAMYRAKARGRHTYEFYTSELTDLAMEHFSVESNLRQALARDEFILHYQPQVDVASGGLCGVEALLRWQHPELGLILPEQFIGIAEESGLIDSIGDWVLRKACAQARLWRESGLPAVRIAVNLSAHQIRYDHTVETLLSAFEENGLQQGNVSFELEITESMLQSEEWAVISTLQQLRGLGVSIAIDDFGTGYSSLSQLKQLPIDTLKIDRSFLRNIPHDSDNKAITAVIVSMGHSLGLRVVAEGVETLEQLEFLRGLRCNEAQGFLISEALAPERLADMLGQGLESPVVLPAQSMY